MPESFRRHSKRKRNNTDEEIHRTEDIALGEDASYHAKHQKMIDIWQLFRDEYYEGDWGRLLPEFKFLIAGNGEAVEQLPLSLHRTFALINELDGQVESNHRILLPAIYRYIDHRRTLDTLSHSVSSGHIGGPAHNANVDLESEEDKLMSLGIEGGSPMSITRMNVKSPALSREYVSSPSHSRTPVTNELSTVDVLRPNNSRIATIPEETPKTQFASEPVCISFEVTRTMLSRIAWLTGEIVRASEEKVNLAQAAYDSVDRHVRLLDHAIKQQEASLSLGLRPGTRPTSIVIPDSNISTTFGPRVSAVDVEAQLVPGSTSIARPGSMNSLQLSSRNRGKDNWRQRLEKTSEKGIRISQVLQTTEISANDGVEESPTTIGRRKKRRSPPNRRLKLTVPPSSSFVPANGDMPIDPHEPRYCYCNQVSWGVMIGCDADDCEREWFHLGCAGLTEAPKGTTKWYCRECKERTTKTFSRKKGH